MRTTGGSAPPVPGGFGFPLGLAVGIAVTMIAVAAGATGHPAWSVLALAATVAGVSAVTTTPATLGTALACWCLHDGFVLGRRGDLVFTPASAQSVIILATTALAAVVVTTVVREIRRTSSPARGRGIRVTSGEAASS